MNLIVMWSKSWKDKTEEIELIESGMRKKIYYRNSEFNAGCLL